MTAPVLLVLLAAASSGAAETGFELTVRVEEGGFSSVRGGPPETELDLWSPGAREVRVRGRCGTVPAAWTARKETELSAGERVERWRLAGDGLDALLEPLHADREDYRLVFSPSGEARAAVRFEPEGGSQAPEFRVEGAGLAGRTRTTGARTVFSGPPWPDAVRTAAAAAALALIRLDPPRRRRAARGD